MNRRALLRLAALAAAGHVLDPDLLNWVPGAKTFFLPSPPKIIIPAFMKGDVITIAGYYALHPISYHRTGHLQQFVVTEDVPATTDRDAIIPMAYLAPRDSEVGNRVLASRLTPVLVGKTVAEWRG